MKLTVIFNQLLLLRFVIHISLVLTIYISSQIETSAVLLKKVEDEEFSVKIINKTVCLCTLEVCYLKGDIMKDDIMKDDIMKDDIMIRYYII